MNKEKHKRDCVEYILEHEYEDFLDYLESGDSPLTEQEVEEIKESVVKNLKPSKKCISLMISVSRYHIFASAWLAGLDSTF